MEVHPRELKVFKISSKNCLSYHNVSHYRKAHLPFLKSIMKILRKNLEFSNLAANAFSNTNAFQIFLSYYGFNTGQVSFKTSLYSYLSCMVYDQNFYGGQVWWWWWWRGGGLTVKDV